jgi:sensor histidine kinase YesM
MLAGGMFQYLAQAVGLMRLRPEALPTSASGLINTLAASQFLLVYWVLTYIFPHAADDARLRILETDQLRRAAELARLRSNLEPHFLLNTLNTISGLMSEEPTEARRLIASLGSLLGDSLDERETETFGEQIEWLRHYVAILKTRHGDRLSVSWDIAGDARDITVPRFLLQPLVENAVIHGALKRPGDGQVHVRAAVRQAANGPALVCQVLDNGPGPDSAGVRAGARGLALVRSRLHVLNTRASLRLEQAGPGTRAVVELPLS